MLWVNLVPDTCPDFRMFHGMGGAPDMITILTGMLFSLQKGKVALCRPKIEGLGLSAEILWVTPVPGTQSRFSNVPRGAWDAGHDHYPDRHVVLTPKR